MQGEDENNSATISLLSETQVVEQEFIKTYEKLPILWNVMHPNYNNKYKRFHALDKLLKIMKKLDYNATRLHVRRKINILRSVYRKDLRKYFASKTIGPDGKEIYEYTPTSWKFHALRFLDRSQEEDEAIIEKNSIVQINYNNVNFEDETNEKSSNCEKPSSSASDVQQTVTNDETCNQNRTKPEEKKKKRERLDVQAYYIEEDNILLDREFEAIGSNVSCKLKRMNPEQRCHAELLINKVLIEGLKNKLTENIELAEVYKSYQS